jgi:hypothetical protein
MHTRATATRANGSMKQLVHIFYKSFMKPNEIDAPAPLASSTISVVISSWRGAVALVTMTTGGWSCPRSPDSHQGSALVSNPRRRQGVSPPRPPSVRAGASQKGILRDHQGRASGSHWNPIKDCRPAHFEMPLRMRVRASPVCHSSSIDRGLGDHTFFRDRKLL